MCIVLLMLTLPAILPGIFDHRVALLSNRQSAFHCVILPNDVVGM